MDHLDRTSSRTSPARTQHMLGSVVAHQGFSRDETSVLDTLFAGLCMKITVPWQAINREQERMAQSADLTKYCDSVYTTQRRKTSTVTCGDVKIGSDHPIALQTMTTGLALSPSPSLAPPLCPSLPSSLPPSPCLSFHPSSSCFLAPLRFLAFETGPHQRAIPPLAYQETRVRRG